MIEFLKNFILWLHEASAEKMCQIVIISHNSAQFEKLNICIVCYITNNPNSWISSLYFTTYKVRGVFLKHHFLRKSDMSFSFDWDHNSFTTFAEQARAHSRSKNFWAFVMQNSIFAIFLATQNLLWADFLIVNSKHWWTL